MEIFTNANNSLDGNIGLPADYPQAVYFLENKGVYYTTRPPKDDSLDVQKEWISKNNVSYLIVPGEHDFLSIVKTKMFSLKINVEF